MIAVHSLALCLGQLAMAKTHAHRGTGRHVFGQLCAGVALDVVQQTGSERRQGRQVFQHGEMLPFATVHRAYSKMTAT